MSITLERHNPWPIIAKCVRERCRPGLLIAWSLVVLTVTTAFCMGFYYTEINSQRVSINPQEAARSLVFPIIIIQAVILMFLGTGAVAFGISGERESGVLDYHRMSPLSTPAKLIGYLFGLPIREYALFLITLPFMAFAVTRGGLGLSVVAHFYLIFFLSVIVYHLTGFVAGMLSGKARRAAVFAQIFVVVLYVGLPNLSHLGLTFFEFLTIRPALFGLIQHEIDRLNGEIPFDFIPPELSALDTFRDIPFFSITLHPTVYTCIVQGVLIATLWHLITRRWRADDIPGFSKLGAATFLLATSTLVLASGWATLSGTQGALHLLRNIDFRAGVDIRLTLLLLYTGMLAAFGIFTLGNCSPSPFLTSKGFHRMRRLGRPRLNPLHDEASSLPLALLAIATTCAGAIALYGLLERTGFVPDAPTPAGAALFLGTLACFILFAQAICERFSVRGRFVAIFVVWIIPFMVFGVLMAAQAKPVLALYIALPSPPFSAVVTFDQAMSTAAQTNELLRDDIWLHQESTLSDSFPAIPYTASVIHILLAAGAQSANIRDRARRRRAALGSARESLAHAASLADAPHIAPAS